MPPLITMVSKWSSKTLTHGISHCLRMVNTLQTCTRHAFAWSSRFIKLPPWVKLIVTGRPQAEDPFAAWTPEWIQPSAEDNLADMRKLLESRLQQGGYVAATDVQAAIQVMLGKSQVGIL